MNEYAKQKKNNNEMNYLKSFAHAHRSIAKERLNATGNC